MLSSCLVFHGTYEEELSDRLLEIFSDHIKEMCFVSLFYDSSEFVSHGVMEEILKVDRMSSDRIYS